MAQRLSAKDWAREALVVISEGGLGALAVESLARRLGATKGSFYWHFENRAALVAAALERWELTHTEGTIALAESPLPDGGQPSPAEQLRRLLTTVVGYTRHGDLEVALLASADDPQVAPVLRRVTERRIAYVARLYEGLGLAPEDARRSAVLGVSVFLGHLQYARIGTVPPEPTGPEWEDYLELVIRTLMPADTPAGQR
ncbi:TetR/AcrR family transcriptional regulator [Ornithinimicrobium cavernae]|uniref:TetR/AcrR family transcriptional regulator n=1 Tax=Ornithinimicrobium cavernae TaxID=2666047 RepID=UPI000D692163|nr:TetR/AcrR family transcriptional regulator [Ornithinimicrobium cavernae]